MTQLPKWHSPYQPAEAPNTHHLAHRAQFNRHLVGHKLHQIEELQLGRYHNFNAKAAVVVTNVLGCMEFFWFANLLALCSLPAVLTAFDQQVLKNGLGLSSFFPHVIIQVSLVALVAWIAQTYIQLVALPALQVSSNAQSTQLDAAVKSILDWMSFEVEGGAKEILESQQKVIEKIESLEQTISGSGKRG